MATRCRGCSAEIVFHQLQSGRMHPVESYEPEEYRVWRRPPRGRELMRLSEVKRLVLITEDGATLTVWQGLVRDRDYLRVVAGPARVVAYQSHFAHCPEAARFRKAAP